MTTWMKGFTWMHLKTQMQFAIWMKFLNMNENESDHHPCGWISSTIDNSINVINFNELSFIHMVICIHVISMLFTCSCFFLYQYSKMYVVNSNHVNKFHSYVPISSKSFTITQVVNFIQGMRLKHMVQFHPRQNSSKSDKFNHMAQFHSCDQVHPNVLSM
jgi:hypothetical protein